MHRTNKRLALAAGVIAALLASVALVACGSSNNDSTTTAAYANGTDRAFATEMIAHHQAAIDMAKVAQDKATKPEIQQLADDIVAAQQSEIEQMQKKNQQLADQNIQATDLGLSDSMMGMSMNDKELMNSKQFDRTFIDMMIPHHQGAIRMARVELAKGKDPQMRELAQAVIAAQSTEIAKMNHWREQWYGASSPAGGVPPKDEKMDPQMDHQGMDHSM